MNTFFITSAKGCEYALEKECKEMGATILKVTHGGVEVGHADPNYYMVLNMKLRIGLRVLVPLSVGETTNKSDLYKMARKIRWEKYFAVDQTFRIQSNVASSFTTHTAYPALVVKDAIADRFRKLYGKRPDVDKDNPDISMTVVLRNNVTKIYLDSTGFSLHKRGYRKESTEAPMMETLAATLIRLSGWDGSTPFYDLMCGSGTLGIEAALFANREFPGSWDFDFAFTRWHSFPKSAYTHFREILHNEEKESQIQIFMNDNDKRAISVAKANSKRAGVFEQCAFLNRSILDFHPKSKNGVLILNPPYGIRLDEKDKMRHFFIKLDRHLKAHWGGFRVCIITPEDEHLREIIMKPTKIYNVYNGDLPCKYGIFDIHH
jgi:putative N6-adenine-specific DNA methylase